MKKLNITKDFLQEEYINNKQTSYQIAKLMNCNSTTVCDYLRRYNIYIRTTKESHGNLDEILTRTFLMKEYIKNKKTQWQIAEEIGCSKSTIGNYLKGYNIKIRTHKEVAEMRDTQGNKNPFYGKHHTEKTKEKIRKSDYHQHQNGEKNSMFGIRIRQEKHWNWQGGKTNIAQAIKALIDYKNWHTRIYKRDFYTCQLCDYKGRNIESHHHKTTFAKLLQEFLKEYDQFSPIEDKETLVRLAIKWKPFWDIDNGITLCEKCHKEIHNNLTKV